MGRIESSSFHAIRLACGGIDSTGGQTFAWAHPKLAAEIADYLEGQGWS